MKFRLDFNGDSPESIEAGTQTPPGWYHAMLEDVYEDEKFAGLAIFKYRVLGGNGGVWTGRYVFDRIGDPDLADSKYAADNILKRRKLLAKRLGLVSDEDILAGRQEQPEMCDAIGREVVLHVTRRSYPEKDRATGQPTGNRRESVGVDFAGVYPIGYPLDKLPKDCPGDMRQVLSGGNGAAPAAPATPARPAPAAARAQADAPDFSDL
jgi:hypothetical protein